MLSACKYVLSALMFTVIVSSACGAKHEKEVTGKWYRRKSHDCTGAKMKRPSEHCVCYGFKRSEFAPLVYNVHWRCIGETPKPEDDVESEESKEDQTVEDYDEDSSNIEGGKHKTTPKRGKTKTTPIADEDYSDEESTTKDSTVVLKKGKASTDSTTEGGSTKKGKGTTDSTTEAGSTKKGKGKGSTAGGSTAGGSTIGDDATGGSTIGGTTAAGGTTESSDK